jgi:N-acetylglucosamine kinase-like BadF-type ATPase
MSDALVIGLDIGGTSTRVLVGDLDGTRVGAGLAGGGNPTTHGPAAAVVELRAALTAALTGVDPARVRAAVVGLAGGGKLAADPQARTAFDGAWRAAGLDCPYRLVGDALVGYVSATAAPDGSVLVAGTGAIAAAVRDRALDRIVDGHGWLLGDDGSGFWLGRRAARAALAVLEGRAPDGPLARAVRRRLLGTEEIASPARGTASDLVQAVNAGPPVALAELAPLVLRAYGADPVARDAVRDAAEHLADSLAGVHRAGLPVVLAGGLLATQTPLAAVLRTRIAQRWPTTAALPAGDGAAGAAWLAALDLSSRPAEELHRRLVRPAGTG